MSTITEPACYLIVRKDDTILFVLREHTGFMDGTYSLPAGRVEAGETYAQGAVREAYEEVGLQLASTDIRHVLTQHRSTKGDPVETKTDLFFEATSWSGEPSNAEPERHRAIAWLPVDALPKDIMNFQRYALMQLMEGKTYCEYGWDVEKTA